jgi:hypothetical protein
MSEDKKQEEEELKKSRKNISYLFSFVFFFQPIHTKQMTPLRPVAAEAATFLSKSTPAPVVTPFFQPNDSEQKKFMSGER